MMYDLLFAIGRVGRGRPVEWVGRMSASGKVPLSSVAADAEPGPFLNLKKNQPDFLTDASLLSGPLLFRSGSNFFWDSHGRKTLAIVL